MARYGKRADSGIGWWCAGPVGALIECALNNLADNDLTEHFRRPRKEQPQHADYALCLLVVVAAVLKADGTVKKSQLNYVKQFLLDLYGRKEAKRYLMLLREFVKQQYDLRAVTRQAEPHLTYEEKLQLIYFLYNTAGANGRIQQYEFNMIREICYNLKLTEQDDRAIRTIFEQRNARADNNRSYSPDQYDFPFNQNQSRPLPTPAPNLRAAYRILGLTPDASDDQIKQTYRQLAARFHPDKVSHLGEEALTQANEKFQAVNDAYRTVCNQRGIR